MNKLLKILVLLPAVLFLVTGIRWLVAPAGTCRSHWARTSVSAVARPGTGRCSIGSASRLK